MSVPSTATFVGDVLPQQPPTEFGKLVGSLRRRLWLVLLVALVGTMVALWAGLRREPTYTAEASLLLGPSEPEITGLQITVSKPESDAAELETAAQVIRSRRQIERTIKELALLDDPEFKGSDGRAGSPPGWISAGLDQARRWLQTLTGAERSQVAADRLSRSVPAGTGRRATAAMDLAVERLDRRLSVTQQGRALVLGIGFSSADPEKAARIANHIARLYIEAQIEARRDAADRATNWLAERVGILAGELARSEAAAQRYRAEHGLAGQRKTDLTDQQLAEISRELTQAEADLAARTARLGFIDELRAGGMALDTLPEVLGSQVIIDLRRQEAELSQREADALQTLGPRHPQVQRVLKEKQELGRRVDREVERISANLANETQVLQGRVDALSRRLTEVGDRSNADEEAELRLNGLEREAAANRQVYEDFLARYKQTREQRELVAPVAQIITLAAPPASPSSLGPKLFAALGLVASLTLGGVAALCLDQFDRGLRSDAEVRAALGLRRLALVPTLPRRRGTSRPHAYYCIERPLAAYTEALRAVLIGLPFAPRRPGELGQVVLVTSAVPGEGKTTLALSLAVYAGHTGRRVLLIDLDLRRPSFSRVLGDQGGLGITDVLRRECPAEAVIVHDPKLQIDYLRTGSAAADPLPLLANSELDRLLDRLRHDYDHIIVDAAPVIAATDAQLLAPRVDKVLFVVRWGRTAGETARTAVSMLRNTGADIAGAVLTQVNMRKHANYRFGDLGRNYREYRRYYVG